MSLHLLYPTVFVLWFLLKPIIEKEPCSLVALQLLSIGTKNYFV